MILRLGNCSICNEYTTLRTYAVGDDVEYCRKCWYATQEKAGVKEENLLYFDGKALYEIHKRIKELENERKEKE